MNSINLEDQLFQILDQLKVLVSQDTWDNLLLNCTKNELLVLMLLYRHTDVNMTKIADYLNIPLNTATGIIGRMEKKHSVSRVRSPQDKRVVTIVLTDQGKEQINDIIQIYLVYGQKITSSLSSDELSLIAKVVGKIIALLKEEPLSLEQKPQKIKKIKIL